MNNNYFEEYTNILERILSFGFKNRIDEAAIEKAISYSSFFQKVERNDNPIISDYELIKIIYPEFTDKLDDVPTYNQCLWAAESYLKIQEKTNFTFELIFLYFPITKMYDCFPIYHEMDFSQIINLFNEEYKKESIFSILLKKYRYSLRYISGVTNIPYNSLYSYKNRRRDIKKMNYEDIFQLSKVFNVRLETLAELALN